MVQKVQNVRSSEKLQLVKPLPQIPQYSKGTVLTRFHRNVTSQMSCGPNVSVCFVESFCFFAGMKFSKVRLILNQLNNLTSLYGLQVVLMQRGSVNVLLVSSTLCVYTLQFCRATTGSSFFVSTGPVSWEHSQLCCSLVPRISESVLSFLCSLY